MMRQENHQQLNYLIIFEKILPINPIIFFKILFLISICFIKGKEMYGAKGDMMYEKDLTLNLAFV